MDNTAFALLVKLTKSFEHIGWVNGLQQHQYDALNESIDYIRKVEKARVNKKHHPKEATKLREKGYTIREIATILGYKHPGSVSHLLNKAL